MQWDSSLVDDRTNDKINNHFKSINDKRAAGHKPTLDEILQGPDTPNNQAQGKHMTKLRRSLLKPMFLLSMLHLFAGHLKAWEKGVPVDCGPAWSREAIDYTVERGAHRTARDPEAIAYHVTAGFTEIVFWGEIKDNLPATFKFFTGGSDSPTESQRENNIGSVVSRSATTISTTSPTSGRSSTGRSK
jgi:hypothetical protein